MQIQLFQPDVRVCGQEDTKFYGRAEIRIANWALAWGVSKASRRSCPLNRAERMSGMGETSSGGNGIEALGCGFEEDVGATTHLLGFNDERHWSP